MAKNRRKKRASPEAIAERKHYAPRKKDLVQPIGNGGVVDRRLDKARTIIALIYGWMEVAEKQEQRRIAGLSWAPKEKHRDVEYAGQLLNELIEDMRRDA